jgi:hypothetical protein
MVEIPAEVEAGEFLPFGDEKQGDPRNFLTQTV